MTRHVVFGTGQIGSHLIDALVSDGHEVTAVNRSGRGSFPGARVVAGDATDAVFTTGVCRGADAVYFCLNAANYARWPQDFPPLQRGVMDGAAAAGARLVVLDNLYAYGPSGGRPLVERMAARPTSAKSATRAAMTVELLAAHHAGRVQVAIGRASDYFGPGVTQSALGDAVFGAAVQGKTAQLMGDPRQPHSYSYAPDVAAGLVRLGTADGATGQIWHLPVTETRTIRATVEAVYAAAGTPPRLLAAGGWLLRAMALFQPAMREYLHTLYQFTEPWVVDDRKFRTTFGDHPTPLDQAIRTTVTWYRERLRQPVPARLKEHTP